MTQRRFTFTAELWLHPDGTWHFLSLPDEDADDIEEMHGRNAHGFGSLRVEVTIGASTWRTSIFPDAKRRTYVLPVKKSVRAAEGLAHGSSATVELVVVD